jgi:hypothetical protein
MAEWRSEVEKINRLLILFLVFLCGILLGAIAQSYRGRQASRAALESAESLADGTIELGKELAVQRAANFALEEAISELERNNLVAGRLVTDLRVEVADLRTINYGLEVELEGLTTELREARGVAGGIAGEIGAVIEAAEGLPAE